MSNRKILFRLKDSLMKKHLISKLTDQSYKIMHDKLEKLLDSSLSPKEIVRAFMNSHLDKYTTFKKKIYRSNIKWTNSKVCSSSKCNMQKNAMKNLRHSFVKAYLVNLKNNNNQSLKRTWQDELNSWKRSPPQYLENHPFRFFWKTSPIDSSLNTEFKSIILDASSSFTGNSNHAKFSNKIDKKCIQNNDTITFMSQSGNPLVIPCPVEGQNFYTIQDFMKNATEKHKKSFFRKAARLIENEAHKLKPNKKLYINTEGTVVPYFHLRLDSEPKYYSENAKSKLNISN